MKSPLTPRASAARNDAQARCSLTEGRRMIASPSLVTSTSSTSNRNSLGRRTACEFPERKTFAYWGIEFSVLEKEYTRYRIYYICLQIGSGKARLGKSDNLVANMPAISRGRKRPVESLAS